MVLDDLVILERVVKSGATPRAPQDGSNGFKTNGKGAPLSLDPMGPRRLEGFGVRCLDLVHSAYKAAGLLAHPEKGSRDSREATFWGFLA